MKDFSLTVFYRISRILSLLLSSNQREEHVEGNLDGVDENQTVLCGDELEVDGMDDRPYFPGTLASTEEVILDLGSNGV
jgi:hypothetical protein